MFLSASSFARTDFFGRGNAEGGKVGVRELALVRIVIDPLRRQTIQVTADAELDRRALEGVGKSGLAAVALIGLFALAAHVHFRDPFVAEPQTQPAHDRTFRQAFVFVLPAGDAQHVVETILDDASVHVGQGQRAIAADDRGLETHLARIEGRGQGLGQFIYADGIEMFCKMHDWFSSSGIDPGHSAIPIRFGSKRNMVIGSFRIVYVCIVTKSRVEDGII